MRLQIADKGLQDFIQTIGFIQLVDFFFKLKFVKNIFREVASL